MIESFMKSFVDVDKIFQEYFSPQKRKSLMTWKNIQHRGYR
jgi:hypothetical protein